MLVFELDPWDELVIKKFSRNRACLVPKMLFPAQNYKRPKLQKTKQHQLAIPSLARSGHFCKSCALVEQLNSE